MSAPDTDDDRSATPLDELLAVLPRWVDRTRSQAEMVRSVAAMLPCVGGLIARRPHPEPKGVPEHERIDVLSVLAEPDDAAEPGAPEPAAPQPPAPAAEATDVPSEADLAIQDYDSLAASQVVPRLATLGPAELLAVQAYEAATRHRQTILNRVAQLLADA